MIKCDVSVNQQRGGSSPVLSEEKVCHLVYFPLVCCLFQPIGRDDNKKILRRPRLTADLPPNPPRDHKALGTTFFSRRERSRSYSLCVNDGSLVIPSHVCSDFGFAYTHRHKSNSPSPPLPLRPRWCLIFQNWYWPTLWHWTGVDLCYFWYFCVPYLPGETSSPPTKFSLISLCNVPTLSLLSESYPRCVSTKAE